MSNSADVSAGDNATATQYNNLRSDGRVSQEALLMNLIRNYPSIELADGSAPRWWLSNSGTLTEEDATGEGVDPAPNERVLKFHPTASNNNRMNQHFTVADEPLLQTSSSLAPISVGAWVYPATAGTVTLRIRENGVGVISETYSTGTGAWEWMEINNLDPGSGGDIQFWLLTDTTGADFYVANPVLCIGRAVMPWKARGLRYKGVFTADVYTATPPPSSWTDLDLSSYCSPLTAKVHLITSGRAGGAVKYWYMRPNGSSASADGSTNINKLKNETNTFSINGPFELLCDEDQIIEHDVSSATGWTDADVSLKGYWEWE